MNKDCELLALSKVCQDCRKCPIGGLSYNQKQGDVVIQSFAANVFSNMNWNAKIMVVGQNPGWDEMRLKEPFVGASGKVFEKEIRDVVGIDRSMLYISNVVRCYTPQNRKPTDLELENCRFILDREIEILQPRIIIALGAMAFAQLTGMNQIMRHQGEVIFSPRYRLPIMVVLHPSPFNMNNPERKQSFLSALKNLKNWMATNG